MHLFILIPGGLNMNIRTLKHLGVVAALVGAMLSASVANASIIEGSKVRIFGTAVIDSAGNVTPRDEATGNTSPSPVNVLIGASGNTGSYAGYNRQNPVSLTFPRQYAAGMQPVVAAGPFGGLLLSLPGVVIGAEEPGPGVNPTFFVMDSWTGAFSSTFFMGTGLGTIRNGAGDFLSNARFELSSPAVEVGQTSSFSGTLIATSVIVTSVIPVPGAMWIFGSGLLLMTAVMRRKVK